MLVILNIWREWLADKLRWALQGEPLRAITYGAVAIVWAVSHLAFAAGWTQHQPPDMDAIMAAVTAGIVIVTEVARRYVYSPLSVTVLLDYAEQLEDYIDQIEKKSEPAQTVDGTPAQV